MTRSSAALLNVSDAAEIRRIERCGAVRGTEPWQREFWAWADERKARRCGPAFGKHNSVASCLRGWRFGLI